MISVAAKGCCWPAVTETVVARTERQADGIESERGYGHANFHESADACKRHRGDVQLPAVRSAAFGCCQDGTLACSCHGRALVSVDLPGRCHADSPLVESYSSERSR